MRGNSCKLSEEGVKTTDALDVRSGLNFAVVVVKHIKTFAFTQDLKHMDMML